MANITPDKIRGFLIPHDLDDTNINISESSFSQQGARAGDPTPNQNSRLIVRATGEQSAGSNIRVKTTVSGHAGEKAKFAYIDNNTTLEYGRDLPNVITGYDVADFATNSTYSYENPSILPNNDGSINIAVYAKEPSFLTNRIYVYSRTEDDETYSRQNIYAYPEIPAQAMYPALCRKENGDILLAFTTTNSIIGVTNPRLQVRSYISSDNGATWSLYSERCIDEDISLDSTQYTVKGLKLASIQGQILMFIETFYGTSGASTYQNRLFQFASVDGGANFTRVTTSTDFENGFFQVDVKTRRGEFAISYIGATNELHYVVLPHAFYSLQSARAGNLYSIVSTSTLASGSNQAMTTGENTIVVDDNGIIYFYYKLITTNPIMLAKYSSDGINFDYMGINIANSRWYQILDTTGTKEMPKNIHACLTAGRVAIAHNFDTAGQYDETLAVFMLGGYSTLTLPYQDEEKNPFEKIKYTSTYVPYHEPGNISAFTVVGTSTDYVLLGALYLSSSTLNYKYYYQAFTTTLEQGLIVRAKFRSSSGGSTTNGRRFIDLKIGDGVDEYYIQLRIDETSMQLYDVHGATNIGTSMTISSLTKTEVIIALKNNNVYMWYKKDSETTHARDFSVGPNSTAITSGGAGISQGQVVFGHGNFTTACTTNWYEFHVSAGIDTGQQMMGQPPLSFMPYPPAGEYTYLQDGVRITTSSGPAIINDTYDIEPDYEYGVAKMFYTNAPSTLHGWRSESVSSGTSIPAQYFAFDSLLDSQGNPFANYPLIGIHLQGVNVSNFTIERKNSGASTYTSTATIDTGIEFYYDIQSGAIILNSTTQQGAYIDLDECAGWGIKLTDGTDTIYTKVVSNTSGALRYDGYVYSQHKPVFRIEKGATIPGGGSATTRIAKLIPPNITILMHLTGSPNYDAIKVQFDSTPTPEDYMQCNHISIGPVLIPGQQYGRGRTIAKDSGTIQDEMQNGVIFARNVRKSRRIVRVAWSDAIDLTQITGDDVNPDIIKANSNVASLPIASRGDVPNFILGMIQKLQGSKKPIVYLPSIDTTNNATTPFYALTKRQNEHMLATLQGDVQIESVIGDELENEAFRISTIVLQECI